MGTARRQFTEEFKREAAQELGIAASRLRAWRNKDDGRRN
jgi:transposase-like protein